MIPFLSGCYTYIPAELEAVPQGEDVRVYLTRSALAELPQEIPADGSSLAGRLVRKESGRFMLRVPVASRQEGFYEEELEQNVLLPTGGILELQRRALDRFRTGLVLAGGTAAAAGILLMILDVSNSAGSPPTPGDPPEVVRVPAITIPIK